MTLSVRGGPVVTTYSYEQKEINIQKPVAAEKQKIVDSQGKVIGEIEIKKKKELSPQEYLEFQKGLTSYRNVLVASPSELKPLSEKMDGLAQNIRKDIDTKKQAIATEKQAIATEKQEIAQLRQEAVVHKQNAEAALQRIANRRDKLALLKAMNSTPTSV